MASPLNSPTSKRRSAKDSTANEVRRRVLIPNADQDLRDLALRVASIWRQTNLQLMYATADAFESAAVEYAALLESRQTLGAGRRPITGELKALDQLVNKHVINVKNYLVELYGREKALTHYPEFGIMRVGKTYTFPLDRNERISALDRLVQALPRHGLVNQRYGMTFWQDISSRYVALNHKAGNTDSALTARVRDKNQLKAELRKVLQSLVLLLQANYPDNYRSVLRQWGFHKEKN